MVKSLFGIGMEFAYFVRGPPAGVLGMTQWDPDAFNKSVRVPNVEIEQHRVGTFKKLFAPYLLKMPCLPNVRDGRQKDSKQILLDPNLLQTTEDFGVDNVAKLQECFSLSCLSFCDLLIGVDNFSPSELLSAVLGPDNALASFASVGHILHVNLKESHLPYKKVIGQILLRHKRAKMVVNKTGTIDNTFRNFSMEVLANKTTEEDFVVSVKENGFHYQFDFSSVYWNPRLSTEHDRVVRLLEEGDCVLDVFAGVGPFAIPAAKKGHRVWANDLNPESYKWLKKNASANKVEVKCFNLDGRQFIKSQLPLLLATSRRVHVVMNLPALAVEFLDAFRDLEEGSPLIHVYTFSKEAVGEQADKAIIQACQEALGEQIQDGQVHFVRNVAPNKNMFRASFVLKRQTDTIAPKRRKQNSDNTQI